jgi:hypothetical protein
MDEVRQHLDATRFAWIGETGPNSAFYYRIHSPVVLIAQSAKGKTYPLKVILEAIVLYYRGETRQRVAKRIRECFGLSIPPRTLSAWLAEYRALTTYVRLREQNRHHFTPYQLIRTTRLHHKQVGSASVLQSSHTIEKVSYGATYVSRRF